MTFVKKISTGFAAGVLAFGAVGLNGSSAFAADNNLTSPMASAANVTSDATYDLIFDLENPGKAKMTAHKAKFVERSGKIHVVDDSGKDLGELPILAETGEGDPLEVDYDMVSDTELEVIFSVPGNASTEGATTRSAGISFDCGLSYALQLGSTAGLIAAPFTGGSSLGLVVAGKAAVWAMNGYLTYSTCK